MGMYDKDENFGERFNPGDRFIVTGMRYDGEINTQYGKSKRTTIEIVTRDEPKKIRYGMLGDGFAAQATRADSTDFPHVAEYVRQKRGEFEVKLLAKVDIAPRAWLDGDDGPAFTSAGFESELRSELGATSTSYEDELGF